MARLAHPTRRDRGTTASRFASLTPERVAAVQASLERGELVDWADLCDRMVARDEHVLTCYETRLGVISGSRMLIEPGPATGDPKRDALADAGADLARRVLEGMRHAPQRVRESLDGIGRGAAVHEIEWRWEGDVLVPELHWLHLRRFRYGDDWRLRICDYGDHYVASGDELEDDRWLVHEPRALPGYPAGGVLRPVMWLFLFKSWAVQFGLSGAEQFAYPFMFAKVPRASDASVRSQALEALEQLSADHRAVIDDGLMFELLESTVKDAGTWEQLARRCDEGISKALLGMTDLTNPTRVGAYAAVETRKGATVDARIAMDERALAATWEAQLLDPLMRLNAHAFGGVTPPTPRLRWSVVAQRREIPQHLLGVASVNELRAAIDLDPIDGGDEVQAADAAAGDGGSALNGAQIESIAATLEKVYAGLMPARAARALIRAGFPAVPPELVDEMLAEAPAQKPVLPESPEVALAPMEAA